MQERAPGRDVKALERGDLVFWRGHVGIMLSPDRLLHANAHHMAVAAEPLALAEARIAAAGGGPITARRRWRDAPFDKTPHDARVSS
jgi:cell wall-associated NlpC family hydrolase